MNKNKWIILSIIIAIPILYYIRETNERDKYQSWDSHCQQRFEWWSCNFYKYIMIKYFGKSLESFWMHEITPLWDNTPSGALNKNNFWDNLWKSINTTDNKDTNITENNTDPNTSEDIEDLDYVELTGLDFWDDTIDLDWEDKIDLDWEDKIDINWLDLPSWCEKDIKACIMRQNHWSDEPCPFNCKYYETLKANSAKGIDKNYTKNLETDLRSAEQHPHIPDPWNCSDWTHWKCLPLYCRVLDRNRWECWYSCNCVDDMIIEFF